MSSGLDQKGYARSVAGWFKRPLTAPGSDVCGRAGSAAEGAEIKVSANVHQQLMVQVGFRVYACPHIIAACHWLADQLEDQPPSALLDDGLIDALEVFDIPVEKAGKILILKDALRACHADCVALGERSASA